MQNKKTVEEMAEEIQPMPDEKEISSYSANQIIAMYKEQQMAELLPCPFCGGDATLQDATHDDEITDMYAVYCDECYSSSGRSSVKEQTISRWNTRAGYRSQPTGWVKVTKESDLPGMDDYICQFTSSYHPGRTRKAVLSKQGVILLLSQPHNYTNLRYLSEPLPIPKPEIGWVPVTKESDLPGSDNTQLHYKFTMSFDGKERGGYDVRWKVIELLKAPKIYTDIFYLSEPLPGELPGGKKD